MSKFCRPWPTDRRVEETAGVGARARSAMPSHILRGSTKTRSAGGAIRELKAALRSARCAINHRRRSCVYCSSATRNQRLVCVVEEPTISPRWKRDTATTAPITCCTGLCRRSTAWPRATSHCKLMRRAESGSVDEVIWRQPYVEGERRRCSCRSLKPTGIRVTRIATHPRRRRIEYADEVTLQRALEGRREM